MKTKIISTIIILMVTMLLIPLIIANCLETNIGIGWIFIFFFGINPIVSLGLGIIAGTDIRKLWWIPLLIAIVFPLLFGIIIKEIVWDLYIYSGIYLILSIIGMVAKAISVKKINLRA